ncbi:unnamed protein product [Ectocarpus sp. 12 AP-2014]
MSAESASDLKEKGNAAFAAKRYEEAEGLYSQAIAMLREEAPHTLFGNRAAARLGLGLPQQALEDAETAIKKDGTWLKGYHRKACAHQAMGERGVALETYRHALDIEPKNKWLQEQVRRARAEVVSASKIEPIESVDAWILVFESMSDSRERLSTLAHLWNQCEKPDRHEIFGQFLSLIAGAGTQHTGVKPEDFTEDMMVSLPMDNYEDLKAKVDGAPKGEEFCPRDTREPRFRIVWESTEDKEKNVIVNDLRHFFLEPLINGGSSQAEDDDDDDDDSAEEGEGVAAVAEAVAELEEGAKVTSDVGLAVPAPGTGEAVGSGERQDSTSAGD